MVNKSQVIIKSCMVRMMGSYVRFRWAWVALWTVGAFFHNLDMASRPSHPGDDLPVSYLLGFWMPLALSYLAEIRDISLGNRIFRTNEEEVDDPIPTPSKPSAIPAKNPL